MATVLPPPNKKQKIAAEEKIQAQEEANRIPSGQGNVTVQFINQSNGESTGAPISIPVADATVKNLEHLLNTLQRSENAERTPYHFTWLSQAKANDNGETTASAIDIPYSIYHSLLLPAHKTTEEFIHLHYTPQAVFRVRPPTSLASSIPSHTSPILCTSFSPATSSRLATGSGDNSARIFDTDTGTPLFVLKGHTSWVLVVSWAPDESLLATGSMDNTIRLWDPKIGKEVGGPLKGHSKWITGIAWEPYHLQQPGRPRFASSSKDATIRIWDATSKRIENVLSGHKGNVSCVRWGGTGWIYSASHDKMIKIWDANKGTLVATLSSHAHWVNHLALSTDFVLRTGFYDHQGGGGVPEAREDRVKKAQQRFRGAALRDGEVVERLISASDDFTMYLWEPGRGTKPLARLMGHQKQVNHVSFSPDGHWIASCGFDNHVKLWSARDGTFVATLRGHVGPVYMACFSPDSRMLVSGSKDTTLKVWDMKTKKMKEDLIGHQDEVFAVDWSVDGAKVGSGGKDKALRLWRH